MYSKYIAVALFTLLGLQAVFATQIKYKNLKDDITEILNAMEEILTDIANTESDKILLAQYDVNVLANIILNAADDVTIDMIKVASERVDSLHKQAEEANVNASDCFVGIEDKLNGAIEVPLSDLESCIIDAQMQAGAEVQIVYNLIQSVFATLASDRNALVACQQDDKCLKELLDVVTNHLINLPTNLQNDIARSMYNIKACSRSFIKCDNVAVSDAQYKVGRVVGLLDKCVHETIFH